MMNIVTIQHKKSKKILDKTEILNISQTYGFYIRKVYVIV